MRSLGGLSLYSTATVCRWFRARLLLCLPCFAGGWHRDEWGVAKRFWLQGGHNLGAGPQAIRSVITQQCGIRSCLKSIPRVLLVGQCCVSPLCWPIWGWISLFWHFSVQPAAFLPFCPLWRNHGPGNVVFSAGLGLWAVVPRLWVLWLRQLIQQGGGQWSHGETRGPQAPAMCPLQKSMPGLLSCCALLW